jgi:hypothetical protein
MKATGATNSTQQQAPSKADATRADGDAGPGWSGAGGFRVPSFPMLELSRSGMLNLNPGPSISSDTRSVGEIVADQTRFNELYDYSQYLQQKYPGESEQRRAVLEFLDRRYEGAPFSYAIDNLLPAFAVARQNEMIETSLGDPPVAAQFRRSVAAPSFRMGDVKSVNSYYHGIRHLAEMDGRGIYVTSGENTALALYDSDNGNVVLQVFGPKFDSPMRPIIWEGIIGRVNIPEGLTPTQLGNFIEEQVVRAIRLASLCGKSLSLGRF